MLRHSFYMMIILVCLSHRLLAQNTANKNDIIEKMIETIAENSDESLDYTTLLENFNELYENPINLNTANKQELERLFYLSEYQIQNLLEYRKNNGLIYSFYELRLLDGFNYGTLQNIIPFVSLEITKQEISPNKHGRAKHFILLRSQRTLENEKGYESSFPNEDSEAPSPENNRQYLGNAWKYYTRYKYISPKKNTSFGFTAENDAGEPFFKANNSQGFDFYSVFAEYKGNGIIQQLNLGDYHIRFGQGLSVWSGLASKKSSFTTHNAKRQQGIKAYHSTDENLFFRGGAVEIKPMKNLSFTGFVSNKKRDANIENNFTQSLINTGLHRNENEFNKKDQLEELVWGSRLIWNFDQTEIGTCFIKSTLSPPLASNKSELNKIFDLSGEQTYNMSVYYETRLKSMHLYGELAQSKSGGKAYLQGLQFQAHPQLVVEAIYRNYAKDYHSLYGNGFGEQSETQNETGFYLGMEFHPYPKWTLLSYYDLYEFPWLKYRVDSPSAGHDFFTQVEYKPNKNVSIYFRFKQEEKPENTNDTKIKTPVNLNKKQYRLHLSAIINENWEIRNRFELSEYAKQEKERGYLIYQDLIYHHSRFPFTANIRYALFDTDSYNSRIYAYENDILYAFSIPAYYNKGSRFYLNFRYKFNRKASLYLRYTRTQYTHTESLGSGNSEISGNTKSELKLQLKLTF
ncbi:helix-hairpin-helix domain-containing protein [Ancylomarina salipaludis]|uniref:Helix-hairpin-helix domain-containing protein n=1 Tax=Ancylomarina salipaludis TaxID=2501299 RepID=A0A4Q1JQB1_9BACT|nr:helix-hairpin-helix domain-containing protein [Ancylomarina salipaludis]RXQ96531.1 helix-hairpin-helix domain-containing protein [Ancylomarina salipaludis]